MAGFTTNKTHKAAFAATRRRFLVMGSASAALCLFPVLAGCSGGSKKDAPDSDYIGSYRAAYTIPSAGESGTFSFSVAQKGDMLGSFVDSSSNASRAFSGHVDNNGTFSGTTTDTNGATTFATSGTISKVISSSTGGDFRQNRNGNIVSGSFSYLTTGVAPATDSAYAGSYSGSYNLSGQTAGPASYSIDKQGNVIGFVTLNGTTGTLRGQVSSTGAFTGTVSYAANDTATVTGALAVSPNAGQSAGNIVETRGGVSRPGTFGAPVALATNTPFLGAYRGTYGIPDVNEAGDVSFTVDPSGAITGSFNKNDNSAAGVFSGSIASDGNFNGTITYPASSGGAVPARSIRGKMVAGAGGAAGKLQSDFTIQDASGVTHPGSLDTTLNSPSNVDSIFRGSFLGNPGLGFSSAGVPGLSNVGIVFTVDKQGKLIGSVGDMKINGSITNDGRITGSIYNDFVTYPYTGKVSLQIVTVRYDKSGEPVTSAGIAGSLLVNVNGSDNAATFTGGGGFQSGQ